MKTINILIVDDQEIYRKGFAFGLRIIERGILESNIFEAGNLHDALEVLKNQKVDLVITDGMFPENKFGQVGDGHSNTKQEYFRGNVVAKEARRKEVRVIGMSEEPRLFENVDHCFKKPIDIMGLINIIKKYFCRAITAYECDEN